MINWTKLSEEQPAVYKLVVFAGFQDGKFIVSSGSLSPRGIFLHNREFQPENVTLWSDYLAPEEELKIVRKVQYFDHEYQS